MQNSFPAIQILFENYTSAFVEEMDFKKKFMELLLHPRAFHRDHLPGHITGSAWIVDASKQFVVLTHHAKLNKWLQPGGHADGNEDIVDVSLREAKEETGLKKIILKQSTIFDIDIHRIPAHKDFAEHYHFDVRFIFEADKNEPLQITDESNDLQWVNLNQLEHYTNNTSILRMKTKTLEK